MSRIIPLKRPLDDSGLHRRQPTLCRHRPACPTSDSPDREAAHLVASYPEQGWSLLCNGVLLFEDTGHLRPDGQIVAPHRPIDVDDPAHPGFIPRQPRRELGLALA